MKKKGLKPLNKKAKKMAHEVQGMSDDPIMSSMPIGCTTIFDTGWETNPRPETPMSNCLSSARDFSACSGTCWWPAQTPDNVTNFPNYQNQCQAIERDWRNLNFINKR
ncbi:MAG TPA: quinohemoprotein amine dehydrogenase subunit gamma [Desulfobacter postgatei]|jgi:hypothetical protein|uniref:quinohemoprotein amine dehydrogenase subunit gamma n=1 Tax=Desulfobacter sp. TaxID=2294 RepID=UPI001B4D23C1|nr:quinohemoprotein amine dehydrogenase subunit gamma [Desulfobacter sp.]MBP8828614.1 quinohemoprotein amine dehydrogenase subunit gamma [Desulfobacter sp.]MBP9599397.1 quinohemoprotein amine dehydrogenase subunit gamma [Desulfobacter sp.]MDQ1269290.1 hypothetical protein [Thermodesulfobacteriota bacterium]HRF89779.1 quinohemoprotein amine dehydrogenase subunit gamma [Desulfobacter postgatei]